MRWDVQCQNEAFPPRPWVQFNVWYRSVVWKITYRDTAYHRPSLYGEIKIVVSETVMCLLDSAKLTNKLFSISKRTSPVSTAYGWVDTQETSSCHWSITRTLILNLESMANMSPPSTVAESASCKLTCISLWCYLCCPAQTSRKTWLWTRQRSWRWTTTRDRQRWHPAKTRVAWALDSAIAVLLPLEGSVPQCPTLESLT
jgi:hypothetical protein